MNRYAAPELLKLGPPPKLASVDLQTLLDRSIAKLGEEMVAAGISWDVGNLNANPGAIINRAGTYRDYLRRQQIDDVVAQTFLGSATGAMLDQRAADYGVVRRVVQFADPLTGTPEILEDDDSFRLRTRLAWEALSVAGPIGGYVFHALSAHPDVFDASVIGPETGLVQPGEVLIVVQSRSEGGIPSAGIVDAIADWIDAYVVVYSDGTSLIRTYRREQSVRPLGARVTVAAARVKSFDVNATLYVSADGDREAIRLAALANLKAYLESRRRVGREVPTSGMIAAMHLTDTTGLPVVDEVHVEGEDIVPNHFEIPVVGTITVTAVPR